MVLEAPDPNATLLSVEEQSIEEELFQEVVEDI